MIEIWLIGMIILLVIGVVLTAPSRTQAVLSLLFLIAIAVLAYFFA
jgi:hypothetical protein